MSDQDHPDSPLPVTDPSPDDSGLSSGMLLAALIGINVIALLTGISIYTLVVEIGLPLALLGSIAIATARRLPKGNRGFRALRWWNAQVAERGGGFYGIVAVLTFLYLEASDLTKIWIDNEGLLGLIRSLGWETFYGFSIESISNGIAASIWPIHWWSTLELTAVWLGIAAWLVYKLTAISIRRWAPALFLDEEDQPDMDEL